MPNFICDYTTQEEIKKLKEENKELKALYEASQEEINGDGLLKQGYKTDLSNSHKQQNRMVKEIVKLKEENKKMRSACLKSVSKLSKKSKELQKEIEELEMRLDATRQVNMCYAKAVSKEREVDELLKGLQTPEDEYEELMNGEYWNKSNNRIYDRPGREVQGEMVLENDGWVRRYYPCN